MLSRLWGGVLRTVLHIGWLRTVGMKTGEIMDSSRLIAATTNVRLKMPQSMAVQLLVTRSLTRKLSYDQTPFFSKCAALLCSAIPYSLVSVFAWWPRSPDVLAFDTRLPLDRSCL